MYTPTHADDKHAQTRPQQRGQHLIKTKFKVANKSAESLWWFPALVIPQPSNYSKSSLNRSTMGPTLIDPFKEMVGLGNKNAAMGNS